MTSSLEADRFVPGIRRLDHVVIRVKDLEPMLRFYTDILGGRLERELADSGLFQLRLGECLVDLVPVDSQLGRQGGPAPGRNGHNVDHVCFEVDPWNEEDLVSYLQSSGFDARIEQRYGAKGFGPSIYISDPEGNRLELKGPPDEH